MHIPLVIKAATIPSHTAGSAVLDENKKKYEPLLDAMKTSAIGYKISEEEWAKYKDIQEQDKGCDWFSYFPPFG